MTAGLIILVFMVFAGLMMSRRMPAILAVPAMAVCVAAVARTPVRVILDQVVTGGQFDPAGGSVPDGHCRGDAWPRRHADGDRRGA
jgi:hypothetical protein